MKWFHRLRQIPVRRHARRLRARWRLHRMEWNGRQRPLEPPPGYERFYTKEEMFPGLKDRGRRPKNMKEFIETFRLAVKLYKHSFFPNPEITKLLKKLKATIRKRKEIDVEEEGSLFDEIKRKTSKLQDKTGKSLDDFVDQVEVGIKDGRPFAENLVRNRGDVLQKALEQFGVGYKEGVSGDLNFSFFSNDDADDFGDFELPEEDNLPVRYEAQNEHHHDVKERDATTISEEEEHSGDDLNTGNKIKRKNEPS